MSDNIAEDVRHRPLKLDRYPYGEFYVRVDEIADPSNPLCNTDGAHCHPLAELFFEYEHYCASSMMTVYLLSTVSREGTSYCSGARTVDGKALLKDGYCMMMLDGHHRCSSVDMLQEEVGAEWLLNHCAYAARLD